MYDHTGCITAKVISVAQTKIVTAVRRLSGVCSTSTVSSGSISPFPLSSPASPEWWQLQMYDHTGYIYSAADKSGGWWVGACSKARAWVWSGSVSPVQLPGITSSRTSSVGGGWSLYWVSTLWVSLGQWVSKPSNFVKIVLCNIWLQLLEWHVICNSMQGWNDWKMHPPPPHHHPIPHQRS